MEADNREAPQPFPDLRVAAEHLQGRFGAAALDRHDQRWANRSASIEADIDCGQMIDRAPLGRRADHVGAPRGTMARDTIRELRDRGFDVMVLHHAEAILVHDLPQAMEELAESLRDVRIPIEELLRGGGGEGQFTQRLRHSLSDIHGWKKHRFEIRKTVDGEEKELVSHEIDHVKRFEGGTFALEIEWNNKDPFFDRDLENFKRLHAEGAISIGAIITRGRSLQDSLCGLVEEFARRHGIRSPEKLMSFYSPTARQLGIIERSAESQGSFERGWAHAFVADKFGQATTHWRKLEERVRRGVGNPCPLLLIGIPDHVVEMSSPGG